jgi:hypothetical protein
MKKLFALLVLLSSVVSGCGSIDAAVDCHAICARYADCYNSSYDTASCETRCRSHSASDTDYRHQADQCNACIDDRACSSATFNCGSQCSSIIP